MLQVFGGKKDKSVSKFYYLAYRSPPPAIATLRRCGQVCLPLTQSYDVRTNGVA